MSQSANFLIFPQRLNYYFQIFFLMITLSIESKSSLKIQLSEFKKCQNCFLNIIYFLTMIYRYCLLYFKDEISYYFEMSI